MSNSEEQPRAKKTKREAFPLSCLPDDLVLNCLARVSRRDLAALSMVSQRYHSLVASTDLYKIRSLIGRTETYVYVCLRIPTPVPSVRWYILRRRKTLDASDLIQIPSLPSQPLEASSVVVLDCSIYVIGGLIKGEQRTSDVWRLDCGTHVWHPVPSMGAARAYGAAGVVDGKIYVFGGCDVHGNYGEVFDRETQTWNPLPPMPKRKKHIHSSMVRDQKVYALDEKERTFYYSPREGKWGTRLWLITCSFVLAKTELYFGASRVGLVHYGDQIIDRWEEKWIMDGRPPFKMPKCWKKFRFERLRPGARMCSSGGKIVLFWDKISLEGYLHHIWSAEISLERLQGGEIWGNIE
ncbi:hypothetical protein HID58_087855, partial [Brassica napus]